MPLEIADDTVWVGRWYMYVHEGCQYKPTVVSGTVWPKFAMQFLTGG